MPPIRLAHVITDLDLGGAETVLVRLIERLDRPRFESLVVSLRHPGDLALRVQAAGVRAVSLGMRAAVPGPGSAVRLAREIRAYRPDVIQGWMYHGNLAASLAAVFLRPRPPVVWNVRQSLASLEHEKPLTRVVIRLCAMLSRRAARIVNNSAASARQHVAIGFAADRTVVIPNGFDTERFVPSAAARAALRREIGLPTNALLVAMVARWHPVKRHDLFLEAASGVVRRGVDAHFVLVGPGVVRDNAALAEIVSLSGIAERVYLLGERDDVAAIMAALDVLVSASGWAEGFPNVVGEAMACGVPCIVTDTGDCAAILGECGLVVPTGDSSALAAGMEKLLRLGAAERRVLGAAGRRRVVERYELAATTARYACLYEELARSSSRDRAPRGEA